MNARPERGRWARRRGLASSACAKSHERGWLSPCSPPAILVSVVCSFKSPQTRPLPRLETAQSPAPVTVANARENPSSGRPIADYGCRSLRSHWPSYCSLAPVLLALVPGHDATKCQRSGTAISASVGQRDLVRLRREQKELAAAAASRLMRGHSEPSKAPPGPILVGSQQAVSSPRLSTTPVPVIPLHCHARPHPDLPGSAPWIWLAQPHPGKGGNESRCRGLKRASRWTRRNHLWIGTGEQMGLDQGRDANCRAHSWPAPRLWTGKARPGHS